ncbi:porin [Burkholderia sp. Bp9012]|uniref:porin n=1 Tax=Burkholderia sp. Bp9012 TaxID=2184562 RepID=UPI000F5AA1AF|nr:porin [Burkholderia sp. Bp9012]RQR79180.1 porin [Burkholderia sp. Bp9012]
MKTSSLIVTLLTGAVSSLASAQSSVTMYGILDENLTYNTNVNGKHLVSMGSGGLQSTRWGIRGVEDLGGGTKALFMLENGFNITNGALSNANPGSSQGLEFGRQAWIGLGNDLGTVTIGRQYDSVVDFLGKLSIADQWGGSITAHPADIDNFNNTGRVNNAIKVASASYQGLKVDGLYSLGGIAGHASRDQVWSLGAGYDSGALTVGVGYLNVRNPNVGFYGDNGASTAVSANGVYFTSPVTSGFASARSMQVIGAGAAYTIGKATLGMTYSNTRFLSLGDTSTSGPNPLHYSGSATFNDVELNLRFQATPALVLGTAVNYLKSGTVASTTATNDGATYWQGAIGADYVLSKRTDVYIVGMIQKASGTRSTGGPAVAAINGLTASSSNRQALARVGMRHKF